MRRLLVLLLLAGCAGSPKEVPQAELDRVQVALAELPGVDEASVSYLPGVAVTGLDTADVDLHVPEGTDIAPYQEAATKVLWQSRVDPLDAVDIEVYVPSDSRPVASWTVVLAGDREAGYRRTWGPRPG